MDFILEGAGLFIYPLGLCSLIAVYIIVERMLALRNGRIISKKAMRALISGDILKIDASEKTLAGRIVKFSREEHPDQEALKAFAELEITRLEKGMFLLDVVISAAPLLGLLGTVAGLVTVFASADGVLPSPELISRGVGLALSTTILGLSIAIPAILGNSFLNRRIDKICARINICVERLIDLQNRSDKTK